MKYPKRSQYKHAKQKKYDVRNWAEYNEGLRRRGDLTVWFDEEAIDWKADKTGKPGGQRVYSDMAIETDLVVRMVYKLAYRQTEGFLHSIASLLGLGIEIPDYSTLCRRSRLLRKKLRIPKAASNQPIHLMIDSTGLRIHVGTARKPVWSKYSNALRASKFRVLSPPHPRPFETDLAGLVLSSSKGDVMDWEKMLAYITGSIDQELLLRNEYLVTENRILRNRLQGHLRLSDGERRTLAGIGKQLGKQALKEVASIVRPDTILGWLRKLVARKFDGSKNRTYPGRPQIDDEIEQLILRFARENRSWGYDRIAGAMANLGHRVSDKTVGNILKRHDIPPAPEREKTTTWKEFIRSHMDVLAATDFFTAEVWTKSGLVTYYVLFFIHLATRRVHIAGITPYPDGPWMTQVARNVTMAEVGFLSSSRYLITTGTRSFVSRSG